MARLKTIPLYLLALVLLCLPAMGAGKPRSQKVTIMSFNIRFVTAKDTAQFSWYKRRGPVVKMIEDITIWYLCMTVLLLQSFIFVYIIMN